MKFTDILNESIKKEEVILGYNEDEKLIVNIKENPSIIITGETGSGKSILLDQILVQLINKYTSLELGIIPIDTSGVELNYYAESKYTLFNAINDEGKSIVAISRVLKEINRRMELLKSANVSTVDEYNEINNQKLPFIVVAIDDDKFLLRNADMEKMLSGIISQLNGLNILFVLATSDVHNKFFELDRNVLASLLITFDYTNKSESRKANISGADELSIGKFIAKRGKYSKVYNNYLFDDNIIMEVINK